MSTVEHSARASDPAISDMAVEQNEQFSELEQQVQRFLSDLESSDPEVQFAVCTRLLTAITAKLTASNVAKAVTAARVPPQVAQQKASPGRSRTKSSNKGPELGRIESRLSQLPDPADPVAAWEYFGATAETVRAELRQEPSGVLLSMLRHERMPPGPQPRGKTSASLATAITDRLSRALSAH